MLTIAKLSRWSINYYNDTARAAGQAAKDAQRANGGLGEYYSERDTRTPVWLCAGDTHTAAELVGLSDVQRAGGEADPEVVARWLDDGVAPNGECGRAFGKRGVHGFDLTFCAPKVVSLIRAVRGDDVADKAIADAHATAMSEAMEYLAAHAGYTRVHNPATGEKDLVRLPGLVAIAYQHETVAGGGSAPAHPCDRAQPAAPRRRAAGVDRRHVAVSRSPRGRGDLSGHAAPRTAPLAGLGVGAGRPGNGHGRARRRRPGEHHRVVATLHPAARVGGPQSRRGGRRAGRRRRSWRPRRRPPARPNPSSWRGRSCGSCGARMRADCGCIGRALTRPGAARRAASRAPFDRRRLAAAAEKIDKAAFTRADLVEIVGAQLPIDTERSPREVVEAAVDEIGMRLTAPRAAHQREGHERFTLDRILAEEAVLLDLVDARDVRAQLWVNEQDTAGLSADQKRAVENIAASPWLVHPLSRAGRGRQDHLDARAGRRRAPLPPPRAGAGAHRQSRRCGRARRRRRRRLHHRQSAASPSRRHPEAGPSDRGGRR